MKSTADNSASTITVYCKISVSVTETYMILHTLHSVTQTCHEVGLVCRTCDFENATIDYLHAYSSYNLSGDMLENSEHHR